MKNATSLRWYITRISRREDTLRCETVSRPHMRNCGSAAFWTEKGWSCSKRKRRTRKPQPACTAPAHLRSVANSGYYEIALLSAGAVIRGALEVVSGRAENAFCFVGAAGHHASEDGFWGFCYLNDVAMAVVSLRDAGLADRFAIIDIDPHFGDGTRDILGPDAGVLHINFHSGYAMGSEAGPSNLDIVLPHQASDDRFLAGVDKALQAAGDFEHDLLFIVFGHDSHHDDYGAFELSDGVYAAFAAKVKALFPSRVCYVLSGGANPRVARRAIGDVVATLAD